MKKTGVIATFVFILFCFFVQAQPKFYTKTGKVSFFSSTSVENISAVNKSVVCLLDAKTGDLQFAILLKGFEFKKALMQEHFNTDYVESDKYPKAEFKGQIVNNSSVNYAVDGNYKVNVKGKLTLHGQTKDVETTGTITVKDGKPSASSDFNILLTDYAVAVPSLYRDNISNSIKVSVDCALDAMK